MHYNAFLKGVTTPFINDFHVLHVVSSNVHKVALNIKEKAKKISFALFNSYAKFTCIFNFLSIELIHYNTLTHCMTTAHI